MKKVIFPTKNNIKTVNLNDVSEEKFYGVRDDYNTKGFINGYEGTYQINFLDLDFHEEKEQFCYKQECIQSYTGDEGMEFFEFDTVKELFKWLSE